MFTRRLIPPSPSPVGVVLQVYGPPVCCAAYKGHDGTIRVLHSLGADLNARRADRASVAFVAAQNGRVDVLRALHQLGADMASPGPGGATPLEVATYNDHRDCARVLSVMLEPKQGPPAVP